MKGKRRGMRNWQLHAHKLGGEHTVEVGCRGFTGTSIQRFLKTVGIRGTKLERVLKELAEEAEQGRDRS